MIVRTPNRTAAISRVRSGQSQGEDAEHDLSRARGDGQHALADATAAHAGEGAESADDQQDAERCGQEFDAAAEPYQDRQTAGDPQQADHPVPQDGPAPRPGRRPGTGFGVRQSEDARQDRADSDEDRQKPQRCQRPRDDECAQQQDRESDHERRRGRGTLDQLGEPVASAASELRARSGRSSGQS